MVFCVNLGDILDARAKRLNIADQCLEQVFRVEQSSGSLIWHHSLGNHDFLNFTRKEILDKILPISEKINCSEEKLYYHFSPCLGYRFIFLDGYDISQLNPSLVENKVIADNLLHSKNPNLLVEGAGRWE